MKRIARTIFASLLAVMITLATVACADSGQGRLNECAVTFDSNGGSGVVALSGLTKGSRIEPPAAPVKEDYVFAGWYKESECLNAWVFENDAVLFDTTLYAKWAMEIIYCDSNSPEYLEVIEPINAAALYMVRDLEAKNQLTMQLQNTAGQTATMSILKWIQNPRLTSIRSFYGRSLTFEIEGDRICEDGSVSQFLRESFMVDLEDVGGQHSYAIAQKFFRQERLLWGSKDYVNVVKPLAQETADALLAIYSAYEGVASCAFSGSSQNMRINSGTPEEYELIRNVLNGYLLKAKEESFTSSDSSYDYDRDCLKKLPLIDDCEIEVAFGQRNSAQINHLSFYFISGVAKITVEFDWTSNDVLTYEYIKYFMGLSKAGYWTSEDPTPYNSEYLPFFEKVVSNLPQKEKRIFTNFRTKYGEDTHIYLPGGNIS